MRANPNPTTQAAASADLRARTAAPGEHSDETPAALGIGVWLRQIRVHQWSKNLLLAVPLVTAHELSNWPKVEQALIAILVFSLVASAVYLVNDVLDLAADRAHPTKSRRPLAAGRITVRGACLAAAALTLTGLGASGLLLPTRFTAMLVGYIGLAMAYSLGLKRQAIVDVVMLAAFYAYRVLIGAAAVSIECSPWLLAFSLFFFLSLALLKRFAELQLVAKRGGNSAPRRAYTVDDAPLLMTFGVAASLVAALVIVLYLQSDQVVVLYDRPEWLWLACPLVLAWSMRVWLKASRGQMHDDPVVFALRDKGSYFLAAAVAALLLMST
ncbi:Decaprenyl-phosphate phosphoribosyltransferase [Pirellulimonas nuda]|uniref:Decaprenyl-phosphate phosphoribosyltransferase n=1 Tax=Pirellulimonas nuda TaxID=2528009 RepID=A0A518D5C9_9BACT|nr:UbiA family prenyltransferase [Pirellulimonas nuda]QDU86685.1 Decaprenyl-phosphate phosphoribosyltransferase [Pirellulimonas nuda]